MSEDHLRQMAALVAKRKPTLADHPKHPVQEDVLGEVDEVEAAGVADSGLEKDSSVNPMAKALLKLTDIVGHLAKQLEDLLDESGLHGESVGGSGSGGRRHSAVLKALLENPTLIYRTWRSRGLGKLSRLAVASPTCRPL